MRTQPRTSSPTSSLVYTFHHQPSGMFTGSFPTVHISILLVSCFVFLLSRFHSLLTCLFVTPLVSSGYLKCICEHRPRAQGFTDVKLFNSSSWVKSLTNLTSLLLIVSFPLSFLGHFLMRLQVCNCVSEDHAFPHFCASTFEKCLCFGFLLS